MKNNIITEYFQNKDWWLDNPAKFFKSSGKFYVLSHLLFSACYYKCQFI